MISIVIPSYKHLADCLKPCLESIKVQTNLTDVEVIVVLNGCGDDGSREFVESLGPPFRYVWLDEPSGYTHSTNVGIAAAKGDFIILLNNDTVVLGPQWIDLLLQPFLSDPTVGITGPLMLHCPDADEDFLVFFCAMISRKCLGAIGGQLDEVYAPGYGEDCAAACEARRAGFKVVRVPEGSDLKLIDKGCEDLPQWQRDKMWHAEYPIYHSGNRTFGDDPEAFDIILNRNKKTLQERYRDKVNTPTGGCSKCGGPLLDGVCIGAENKLNCDGLYLWRASVIDGWFGVDEGAWLAAQVKALPKGAKVMEIGSWHGRSSRFIADNLPEGGQVWCCDTFNGSSGEPEMHGTAHWDRGDHAFQYWWCNLQEHIEAGRCVPVRMHSENASHTFTHLVEKGQLPKFDLIFIDGDHSEEGIKTDVEAWLPLLKDGGLMCGHDYYKEHEGPHWVHVRQYVEQKFPQVEKSATSIWHVRPHEQKRGHVYDCFIASNELDLIEMRLATLDAVVDRFVIVEGTQYHNGEPKPLFIEQNLERFAPYLHKITHIVVDDWPKAIGGVYDNAWMRERWQRDAIMRGLQDCQPSDIIILGDADEIANSDAVAAYDVSMGLCRLKQRMFYYYLNCENKEGWDWQKIAPYKLVKQLTPCGIRYPPAGDTPLIESGGWHFSMLGGADAVRHKLATYSHQEFNRPDVLDGVESAIVEGRDIFGRDLKYEFVEIDSSYPEYVRQSLPQLIAKGFVKVEALPNVIVLDKGTELRVGDGDIRVNGSVLPFDRPTHLGAKKHWTVTAEVSTKDRYHVLPTCLTAIITQTRKPDKLVIYDDGELRPDELMEKSPFKGLFQMCDERGIKWVVFDTPKKGQVTNHQHCLDEADTDFIWRVDDDEVPMPDCLERLVNTVRDYGIGGDIDNIGAVGGLVLNPSDSSECPTFLDGTLKDVQAGLNLSWYKWNGGPREVQHLYSTFLLRVDHARKVGGYPRTLSPVGHHEESIMTHLLHRGGFKVVIQPLAVTYHLRESSGGIRSFNDPSLWDHDEQVWQSYLQEWGAGNGKPTKLIVLDAGIGDHFAFKSILPKLREIHADKELVLSVCFPQVFDGENLKLISIADAKAILGERYEESHLYKALWERGSQLPLAEAMLQFWQ